ncbi:hypothetical protein GCM10008171_21090 [Methylopila jiangsuensis]|uniref:Uncharacterized protein n=1 Tax=Methylopila jiangsuensis TaxID=586230 RepID=A0A9W6N402_9HYPH|nr:hypothetical protein GCM10008171_21090 [Methylopila jiangsuensis]
MGADERRIEQQMVVPRFGDQLSNTRSRKIAPMRDRAQRLHIPALRIRQSGTHGASAHLPQEA